MRRADPKLRLTRRDTFSAIIMTLKISLKAGKGGAAANALVVVMDAITRPINAVLEGALVTAIVASIATQDFLPVLWIFLALLGIKLVMNLVNRFTALRRNITWQSVYTYTDEMMAVKYSSLPLVTRESKEGAELFERAQKYQGRIVSIFYDTIQIFGNIIGFVAAFITLAVVSPILSIIIVIAIVVRWIIRTNIT